MTSGGTIEVLIALASLDAARQELASKLVNVEAFPVDEQILVAQQCEHFRRRWSSFDLQLLAGLDRADAATELCQGNLRRVLTAALGISKAEAARRVHAYENLGPRRSMLGEELGPIRPVLAEAVVAGEVSIETAAIITRGLKTVDRPGFDPADLAAGEKLLVEDAKIFAPEELKLLAQRVVDAIDHDGTKPDERLQHDRRWFEMHPTSDGGFAGRFRLTATCGVKLATLLRPLSRSRVDDPGRDADEGTVADSGEVLGRAKRVDDRTFGQRQHDALEDCLDRLLREGTVRDHQAPVTVIVTVAEADLHNRTGHATTTAGGLLATETLLGMADQAETYTAVLNGSGVPLRLDRRKRCATRHQSMALIARDIGCSFPGCAQAAEYCKRHHVVPWIDGGKTDFDNLTLLCVYHHHNFLQRGWTVKMNHRGLPEWRPPTWVDPQQRPLVNQRIRAAHQLE